MFLAVGAHSWAAHVSPMYLVGLKGLGLGVQGLGSGI